jgi:hypothetical protein
MFEERWLNNMITEGKCLFLHCICCVEWDGWMIVNDGMGRTWKEAGGRGLLKGNLPGFRVTE